MMKTTQDLIQLSPTDAVFVCGNQRDADRLAAIARVMGRQDIRFVSMFWLTSAKWHGMRLSAIVLDADLWDVMTQQEKDAYRAAKTRIM